MDGPVQGQKEDIKAAATSWTSTLAFLQSVLISVKAETAQVIVFKH